MICILGPAIDGIYAACLVMHLSHLTLDTWVPWRINKLKALVRKSLYLKMVMRDDSVSVARHSQVSCSRAHDLNSHHRPILNRPRTDGPTQQQNRTSKRKKGAAPKRAASKKAPKLPSSKVQPDPANPLRDVVRPLFKVAVASVVSPCREDR